MAQLSDDCFAFGGALMSVEEAQALIAERIPVPEGEEEVPLGAARGRVLARDLVAPMPLPPFANAAVDGWALRHEDLAQGAPTRLIEAGRVAAGHVPVRPAGPGEAVRVFTGAPMPGGTDTCVMQEDVRREGIAILVPPGLKRGANARPAGEDVAQGAVALASGTRLGAAEIGLAAALGQRVLPVRRLPRIGVFSTGDELAEPGARLGPAQTYDSNRFTLLALLAGLPCIATDLGILPDDATRTAAALGEAARGHDLLLTSGGVSTGEEDHVRAAIEAGGRLVFWRLAVKPGRPAAMGVLPKAGGNFAAGATPVIGLPGNPVAAVVCFLHLARPLLLRLAGAAALALPRFAATADFAYRKKAGRREFVRVTLRTADGATTARRFPREGAGLLSSLTQSDGFAELPEEVTEVAPGGPRDGAALRRPAVAAVARVPACATGGPSLWPVAAWASGRRRRTPATILRDPRDSGREAEPFTPPPLVASPVRPPSPQQASEARPGRGEGGLRRLLDLGVEHIGRADGDDDGDDDARDDGLHAWLPPELFTPLSMAPGQALCNSGSRRSAASSSSGALALKNGSTGRSGQSAWAQPWRAVQRSILRSPPVRAARSSSRNATGQRPTGGCAWPPDRAQASGTQAASRAECSRATRSSGMKGESPGTETTQGRSGRSAAAQSRAARMPASGPG